MGGLEAVDGGVVVSFEEARRRRAERELARDEPWRSKRDVAAHLGNVSTKTVERYMKLGLPFSKPLENGAVKFKLSEVDEWVRARSA